MSIDLHKMQVEITAEINKFKQKCEAVKAEAKRTSEAANKALAQIGDEKFASKVTRQYEEIRKQTQTTCNKIKQFSKQAQIDAGLIEPTREYAKLEKQIASTQQQINKLKQRQDSLSDKDARVMTKGYSACADQVKKLEDRIDSMIAKQQSWLDVGVDPKTSSAFQELDKEIEGANAELKKYQDRMAQMESDGKAFVPSDKWKNLQRQITAAREEMKRYQADAANMQDAGTAYKPTKNMTEGGLYKSWAKAGKNYIGSIAAEAAKTHPAIKKLMTLMQKFGNTSKQVGAKGKSALKGINTAAKLASYPFRMLASGFGKVYQKIKSGISVLNRFRSSTDSLSHSCGKLMGRMGALRITATYMLASFMIMGGINAMKEGFKNLSQYSSQTNRDLSMLMSSLTQLKNSLATAFAPILTVVAPIISTFIDWLSAGMTAIAHFMAAITGKNQVVVARKVNQNFAGSIADTGSAADGATDSVEKYKRSLMGFDQINKLDDPTSNYDGSSSGSGGGAAGGVSPSDMFETVEVGSTFLNWADKFKEAWESADFTEIGQIVGEKLNAALESIPWDKIKETSAKIAKSIATFLNGFIDATNWRLVGSTLAEGINTVIEFGYTFVTTFNWAKFGTAIGEAINGFFADLDLAKAGKTLSEGIKGILETINTALKEVNWKQVGQSVGDFLTNIDWLGVLVGAGKAIANALIAVLDFADGLFESICDGLKNMSWKDVAKAVWELFKVAWKLVGAIVDVAVSLIKNAWSTIANFVGDAVEVVISLIKTGWDKLTDFVGDKVEAGVSLVKDGWNKLTDIVGDAAKSIEMKVKAIKDRAFDSIVNTWNNLKNTSVAKKLSTIKDKWSSITSSWAGYKSMSVKKTLKTVKGAWSSITAAWSKLKGGSLIKKLLTTVKLPKISWITKTFKKGPIKINYPWPSLSWQKFAKGGFPEEGPFMMNRGEIAGKFSNGKGVVANNQQITTGIANAVGPAVYKAVLSAMSERSSGNGNMTIVLQGDAKGLFKVVKREAKNYMNATGQPAFPV